MRFKSIIIIPLLLILGLYTYGQEISIPDEKTTKHTTGVWLGLYTKYRIGKKIFYYGEYHYRRRNNFQDMAQVYLRFGATYLVNNSIEITSGVVTPLYWAPNQDAPNIDKVVPQYRLWQQLLFVQRFDKLKVYHQIRTEQRWKRDYVKESPFELTWRFRYKISTYIPLNNKKLISNTLFFSACEEIFIQAGKTIIYDHMEDNRLFIGLGYILDENIQIQAGYMWTYRHAGSPFEYEHRHIPRLSIYHNLDFYKGGRKKKEQELNKILNSEF